MTIEQLQKELNSNNAEIDTIKKEISTKPIKNKTVDSVARLNYLNSRNKEIESLLAEKTFSKK
jgi:hypothetical protein